MIPLPYQSTLYGSIYWIACLIWLVPEWNGAALQSAEHKREAANVQDRGSMYALIGLLWVGLFLNFALPNFTPWATITWHRTAVFFIGIACILLGVALRWYAIWSLGRYFTRDVAVSSDQQVVQSGPYHFIRHPAYSGTLLAMVGFGLGMTNWVSLAVIVIFNLIGHLYRVRVEERALSQTIGRPYVEYMKHTKRFVPFVF